MARVAKSLANQDDIVGPIRLADVIHGEEINAGCSLTLAANAQAGTVVLEGSPGRNAQDIDIWIQLPLIQATAGVDSVVASLVGGASNVYGRGELVGMAQVRGRLSVAGAAPTWAILAVKGI